MKLLIAFTITLFSFTLATVLTTGSRCSLHEPCPEPLSCVGNPTNLKCFKKKELGERCGQDPFWVCEDGLSCIGDVCKQVIDKAGSCGAPNTVCAEDLSCVGNPTNLKCFKKKELGERCGQDPFWVCEDGLSCIGDVCKQVIDKAGRCGAPNTVCAEPLSCVGNPTNLKCFKKKEIGERCGQDPFWVCEDGLSCVDDVCKQVVEQAGSCGAPNTVCAEPLSCVGNARNLKCFKKRELGMKCGKDPFWVCEDGLSCVDDVCKRVIVEQGGSCDAPNTVCGPGLECWDTICVY